MKKLILISAMALAAMSSAFAEEMEKGQMEAVGFVGGMTDGAGATLGGGIHYGINERLLFAGELGYMTASSVNSGVTINANVHYLFPLKNNEKLTPYALGGIGIQRFSGVAGFGGSTHGGVNIGGGARYAAGTNWGVRPEMLIFITNGTNVRFSVGVYYKFGK
jgi:hypothetical protein